MNVTTLLSLTFFTLNLQNAFAKPEYAEREGKACQYCHVESNPGKVDGKTGKRFSTERGEKGLYYGNHNHSFAGYVTKVVVNPLPKLTYAWQEVCTDLPTRVAVADVTGDGVLRLISLHEKPGTADAAILKVRRWNGKGFDLDFSTEVKGSPARLAVGKFAGKKNPSQIVTENALFVWDGKTYQRKEALKPIPILGVTRPKDDVDRLLVFTLVNSQESIQAYRIDSTAKEAWLVDPVNPQASTEVEWRDMHASTSAFEKMGWPEDMSLGDAMGLWILPKLKDKKLYLYQIKAKRDFDLVKNPDNPRKPTIVYTGVKAYSITVRDITSGQEFWGTPQIQGTAFDVTLEDPKNGGKPGFLTLFSGSTPEKPRILYFFQFD